MRSFFSWQIGGPRAGATGAVHAGRLQAQIGLRIRDLDDPARFVAGDAHFELLGPGDVVRLAPGAISRRYPLPGAQEAEETKMALVEFAGEALLDLPWRYTPQTGAALRPWMVLVVGRPDGLVVGADGMVALAASVQAAHDLSDSARWAHVHQTEEGTVAQILCPVDLASRTRYVAALVPAFIVAADGTVSDAWHGGQPWVHLPCYDSWQFATGPEGDFPQLAGLLQAVKPSELDGNGPRRAFGRAPIRYDRRRADASGPGRAVLMAGGALQRPADAGLAPPPADPWVEAEVVSLSETPPTTDGRWILTAPVYPAPFSAPGTPFTSGWRADLTRDPRYRGMAGLGLWAGIEWQDAIAAAAVAKAGDIAVARDRIAHLGLGLEAARSLWRRHVPADPVERLAVLAPVLARLPASGGGTVLDALAGRTPALSRALLSSAARRALRPGPARSARAQPGAGRFGAILTAAGQCPPPCREYVPRVEGDRGFAVKALRARMAALAPEGRRCQPVDMVALGKRIGEAVDPTVARPLVVDRVLGTLPGIKSLGPVEIQPELDLPLWSFLARRAPDWLLPGIGRLPDNRVLALATNPAFVEAMLAGANCQALSELRWRNLPIVSGWSPMRKFWQRKGGEMDIQPIGSWPDGAGLGGAGLQPAGVGVEAVILFRTSLFRRYPGTAVFLYRDESGDWEAPPDKAALEPARKIFPIFTGSAGDDIVFFGFPVAPAALKRHWVVLEEPPSGYRFYTEDPDGNRYHDGLYPDGRAVGASALDAANFAYETFATPVRVMIGALLEDL